MKIGIIGAGHIGGTLARRLTALGHDVLIANSRGPESLPTSQQRAVRRPYRCPKPLALETAIGR